MRTRGCVQVTRLSLVCQRWHAVVYAELWHCMRLEARSLSQTDSSMRESWLEGKAGLLRRVGRLVSSLHVDGGWLKRDHNVKIRGLMQGLAREAGKQWRLQTQVLDHLSPAQLTSLHLEWSALSAQSVRDLARFTRLTHLALHTDMPLHSGTLDVVARLPSLQSVHLGAAVMPPMQQLSQLTSLTGLTYLGWYEDRRSTGPRLTPLALPTIFPSLVAWSTMALTALSDVHSNVEALEVGGSLLRRIDGAFLSADRGSFGLDLHGLVQTQPLQELIDSMLPAGAALHTLSLVDSRLQPDPFIGCAHLAGLRSLELSSCNGSQQVGAVYLEEVLEALLQQAHGLEELTLVDCKWGHAGDRLPPPPCVRAKAGLKRLRLLDVKFGSLPAGPYLERLEELHLRGHYTVSCLGAALVQATGLTRLVLHSYDSKVAAADVASILAGFPILRQLALDSNVQLMSRQAVLDQLSSTLPRLQVTFTS